MKDQDRIVYQRSGGDWVEKRVDADRAGSVHPTQRGAQETARERLRNSGGGELITKGENGKIRAKDTVSPGKDAHPPKG